ncbi:hypothetical protein BDV29DRAFT_191826 [Aspergillus leporis]|uniref:Major facilitator superfamily domain-containing protein n=1 Tax=Aspergillus leporis TaxID=41062 RepID=A0A5N5WXM4_9EURO|nr:hypothetical protein BDV29DRAFT_191826 [Aspergillus leporis]
MPRLGYKHGCETCGLLFSFGIYQSLYEDMSREENTPFTGGLLFGIASVRSRFGTALWHFQLTQGLLIGIATCLSFMPSMAVPPSWCGMHRGVGKGIISAGTGIGGLVWSPILTACIQSMSFRNTLRLTGCICTALICASGASDSEGSYFTSLSNACNAIGKVRVGFVSDRIGRLDSLSITTLLSAVSTAGLWVPGTVRTTNESSGKGLFIGLALLYGLFASAYIGMLLQAWLEPPVAGVLVRSQSGSMIPDSYLYMATFVGALMVASTVAVFWTRIEVMVERAGGKWKWRL